ncbi:hypothetical protein CUTER_09000 [Corynebacterium uterequi]|uniref:Transmembrane protein n=1 Tax=Corynebacterium uterequi TaxID=1072256 RepID=A0A0G3HKZ2_9CORY|nr:hypothetical protein CUTER_09000 [Corynebacterium uterequi]
MVTHWLVGCCGPRMWSSVVVCWWMIVWAWVCQWWLLGWVVMVVSVVVVSAEARQWVKLSQGDKPKELDSKK